MRELFVVGAMVGIVGVGCEGRVTTGGPDSGLSSGGSGDPSAPPQLVPTGGSGGSSSGGSTSSASSGGFVGTASSSGFSGSTSSGGGVGSGAVGGSSSGGSTCPAATGSWSGPSLGSSDGGALPPVAVIAGATLTVLATGQTQPYVLAVDGTSVYWGAYGDGTVMKVPRDGGASTTLASGQKAVGGIAVDATSVYFSALGGASKVPLAGGAVTPLGPNFIDDTVAVGPSGLYGTDGSASLLRAALDGSGVTTLAPGPGDTNTYGIAVDDTSVYWTDFRGTAALRKVPLNGGPIVDLATTSGAFGVTVDATSVYWVQAAGGGPLGKGALLKIPLGGGTPTVLASCLDAPYGLAVDTGHVYVSTGFYGVGSGAILRVPVAGGDVTTLVSGLNEPSGIAIDDASVYWTTLGGEGAAAGSVMKLTPK